MAKGFYTDNMTVSQILSMSNEELSKLNKREVSRALRTVALAANKRVTRLKANAKKTKEGYVQKQSAKKNIAMDALNAVTSDGKKNVKFGVRQSATRNKMIEQIGDIRRFMNMKTSTVTGAVQVRKNREKQLFGKTLEQAQRGRSKKQKAIIARKYREKTSQAYSAFRKYLEYEGIPNSPYIKFAGSDTVLDLIGKSIINGSSEDEALEAALEYAEAQYEQEQEEFEAIIDTDDFWEI